MNRQISDRIAFYSAAACIAFGIYYKLDFARALLQIGSMIVLWALLAAVFQRALDHGEGGA